MSKMYCIESLNEQIQNTIKTLRYLESLKCRMSLPEGVRLEEIKDITNKFRGLICIKHSIEKIDDGNKGIQNLEG